MKKQANRGFIFSSMLLALGGMVLLSAFLVAERVFLVRDNTPQVQVDLLAASLTQAEHSRTGNIASDAAASRGSTGKASFATTDSKQIWSTETVVNLFSDTYTGLNGMETVNGTGDRLVAPGTENSYTFQLNNTGSVALDYRMEVEAYFGSEAYQIPVEVQFSDKAGTYYAGSETDWAQVLELNNVADSGVLAAGQDANYTLNWRWLYEDATEGGDTFDTALGNWAVDEDLTLTVIIRTYAEADVNLSATAKAPKTGDTGDLAQWMILGGAACAAIVVLLVVILRKDKQKKEEPYGT
jgi:hypothetical protein